MAFFLLLVLVLQASSFAAGELTRCSFPKGFIFGTASAAYQYEGAVNEDGRKPSIWDTIAHTPGRIKDGSTGDVAEDQYHRYPEDIQLMKNMNMDAYRFSISWSRIFPNGDGVNLNPAGVKHYNMLINALLQAGIQPYVTLYHWDLPQALEDSIGGWLSPKIIERFAAYAEACFEAFGDRVKHWITFNEPLSFVPSVGNALTGPYIAGHNVLLSHAAAVEIYRNKYQARQKGKIGITLDASWYQPLTSSSSDKSASRRALDFNLGWFLNPVLYGEYPQAMRVGAGSKLPMFSLKETELLRGSIDFLGLNHYTSNYAASAKAIPPNQVSSYFQDARVTKLTERNGVSIGPRAASEWLYIVPWGFDKLLTYIAKRYKNLVIIITENGVSEANDPSLPLQVALQDQVRVKYYKDYLSNLLRGMRNGANVQGYFAWSLLDNFEWTSGYTVRFGLHFVDYNDNLKRYPKHSASWFGRMLNHTC